jgi:hypothetical protein
MMYTLRALLVRVPHKVGIGGVPAPGSGSGVSLLLMRYSGRRLNDAVTLERIRLTGNRLFLYQQKTGLPVYLLPPPHIVELLPTLPNQNLRYFFWTGNGLHYRASDWLAR